MSFSQCEYPDAPPNLTDLSKKVLDLYDSLRDLEGELLYKYLQPSSSQRQQTSYTAEQEQDNEALDEKIAFALKTESSTPIASVSAPLLLPDTPHQGSQSPVVSEKDKPVSPLPHSLTQPGQPPPKEITWSMSYLANGVSIQTTTHTISEFVIFINKLTQDFGNTDPSLSACWELDDQGMDPAYGDSTYDDEDELDEDAYLVTVPIFDISYFLQQPSAATKKSPPPPPAHSPILDASTLPALLQYVYRTLNNNTDTSTTTNSAPSGTASGPPPPYHHVTLLLDQLKSFLPAQDDFIPDSLTDPLTSLYIFTAYLTCTTFYNTTTPATDYYTYTKALLIDLAFQIPPTYSVSLSILLLTWIQVKRRQKDEPDDTCLLLDLAWRMIPTTFWPPTTFEAQLIGTALIYLNAFTLTFHPPTTAHLDHDVGSALRHQLLQSLPVALRNDTNRPLICMLLESQLMWFHHQVLGLFYTTTTHKNNDAAAAAAAATPTRKVDVDEVLTLVRDLEQWEQHLPPWAMWPATPHLHLTLNMIKILLFRPFCIEFNQSGGVEQTYTKTTFLDLSLHSADRLATCLTTSPRNCWTWAAHQMIWDVVTRVQTTFDYDPDIKVQLDALIHRIDPILD
ncbi:hypothetical protein [Absidia glauca]|uniref:Transcription factor domain-containing protein n=1 Tax=Absidia glauca TaxID=4829 RepID=A0A168LYP6_ABSGL|nr:hypothetical protein [Absidia glauca]